MSQFYSSGTKWLIGLEVRADHPITCLNPEPTFKISEVKIENDKLYVRGEQTMWFHGGMIASVNCATS